MIQVDLLAKWLLVATLSPGAVEAIANELDFFDRLREAYESQESLRKLQAKELGEDNIEQRNKIINATEAVLKSRLKDPRIKALINVNGLIDLLDDIEINREASLRYLHLAQIGVGRSVREATVKPEQLTTNEKDQQDLAWFRKPDS